MKNEKIVHVQGGKMTGLTKEEAMAKILPANVTVKVGETVNQFDDLDNLILIAGKDTEDGRQLHIMVHGGFGADKVAHILSGMRNTIGKELFDKAMLLFSLEQMMSTFEDEEPAEDEE